MMRTPHVRVEMRKVYVSARGVKLTKHAAYIAAAKELIAACCSRWDRERAEAMTADDHNGFPVLSESYELCDKNGSYQCRFHRIAETTYHHDGEPMEGSGRMVHYNRVLPRLVRFLKFVDRRRAERAP